MSRPRTLRSRLLRAQVLGFTLVLALAGLALHRAMEHSLYATLDRALQESLVAHAPSMVLESVAGGGAPGPRGRPVPRPSQRSELTFQVRDLAGVPRLRSGHLSADLPRLGDGLAPVTLQGLTPAHLRYADLEHVDLPGTWRAVGLVLTGEGRPRAEAEGPFGPGQPRFAGGRGGELPGGDPPGGERAAGERPFPPGPRGGPPRGGPADGPRPGPGDGRAPPGVPPDGRPEPVPVEVVIATDARPVHEALETLAGWLVVTWLATSLMAVFVSAGLLRRGLAPLDRLQQQIAAVREPADGASFDLPDAPAELVPVVQRLESLVARMAAAVVREQEFSGHAAHELRTPLAGLRATLEVALSRPREPEAYRRAAATSLAIVEELSGMVETLLLLAREEGAGVPAPQELAVVVAARIAERDAAAGADGSRGAVDVAAGAGAAVGADTETATAWDVDVPAGLSVRIDRDLLRHLLANLLGNAVAHGDGGGPVDVRARRVGDRVVLRIANPASGAVPEVAQRAFDPFWRGDEARTAAARHAGLGLPLCRRIAERVGGRIDATWEAGTFAVTLELPAAG